MSRAIFPLHIRIILHIVPNLLAWVKKPAPPYITGECVSFLCTWIHNGIGVDICSVWMILLRSYAPYIQNSWCGTGRLSIAVSTTPNNLLIMLTIRNHAKLIVLAQRFCECLGWSWNTYCVCHIFVNPECEIYIYMSCRKKKCESFWPHPSVSVTKES